MAIQDFTINIYGANWCRDCRRIKKYLGEQRVHYNWVDIEIPGVEGENALKFVLEANKEVYGIEKRKIPVVEIIRDEQIKLFIEPSNLELAEELDLATKASKEFYHAIVVGAGPSGLTAAIYLARDGYDVLVVEKSTVGGQAFITNRLDNFPGFPEGITGEEFAKNLRKQAERFNVEILVPEQVSKIEPCHEDGNFQGCLYKKVYTSSGKSFHTLAVLIATGSEYRQLIVPGYENILGVNLHYCATCDGYFYKDREIFVVGGGNSAFEEAIFLKTQYAKRVTIIIRSGKPRASLALQEKVKSIGGIDIWLNSQIKELIGETSLEKVLITHTDKGETREYRPDGIFVFIGLTPNTRFLNKISVELDPNGFITTDEKLQSSIAGIFAAGDCRHGSTKQAVAAAGEGAAVAIAMRGFLEKN
ncbi:MAG: FAD-dependent oxidoreductase [Candidatus Heimdallarchaeota archaeon]